MVRIKGNLAPGINGLGFRIERAPNVDLPIVAWSPDPVTFTADEILSPRSRRRGRGRKVEEAVNFLRGILARGPMPADEVKREAHKFLEAVLSK